MLARHHDPILAIATAPGRAAVGIVRLSGKDLRPLVKAWLSRRKDVLAFCHAPSCDGGEGALWILLQADKAERR